MTPLSTRITVLEQARKTAVRQHRPRTEIDRELVALRRRHIVASLPWRARLRLWIKWRLS